jgi:hypothetical protein
MTSLGKCVEIGIEMGCLWICAACNLQQRFPTVQSERLQERADGAQATVSIIAAVLEPGVMSKK